MKKVSIIALSMACTGFAYAGSEAPILMTAKLSLTQVSHKLFKPSASNVPHPFYKAKCAKSTPKKYASANGQAVVWYNPKTNVMKYAITYQGLSGSPIMAHFHIGQAGKGGPIVQTICGMPPKGSKALGFSAPAINGHVCPQGASGFFTGTYKLHGNAEDKLTAAQEKQALLNGKLYINIHTCLNELGELRGQIVPFKRS
ncbi:MAG: CHRD domain-containing protein [Coxiellaceae bacterium]|nr:CHRD domain-containing protein [Coxiellaceae bacterium]